MSVRLRVAAGGGLRVCWAAPGAVGGPAGVRAAHTRQQGSGRHRCGWSHRCKFEAVGPVQGNPRASFSARSALAFSSVASSV